MILTDEVWEGEVRAGGAVVVTMEATLTLAPGARVVLAPGSSFVVRGKLVASGTADAPVVIESVGGPWAGVAVLTGGAAELSHVILREVAGDGLGFYDGARGDCADCRIFAQGRFAVNHRSTGTVKLERCALSGAKIGLSAFGGPLELRATRFTGQEEAALELSCEASLDEVSVEKTALGLKLVGGSARARGFSVSARDGGKVIGASRLEWSGGSCAAESAGLSIEGGEARLEGVAFAGGESGISVRSGTCAAARSSFRGQSEAGAWCGEEGTLELADCELSGAPTGVGARRACALSRCRFSGHSGQALDLHGAGHRVSDCAISDCEVGAAVSGGAEFSGVRIEARRHAVVAASGAELAWRGGRASAGETALLAESASASLRDVGFSGGEGGVLARGGRLAAEGCSFERHSAAGVELQGGEHELASSTFSDCGLALLVAAGRCRGAGLALAARETGALVRPGASLELSGSTFAGGATGAFANGGAFEARDCVFSDQQEQAVLGAGAFLKLSGCELSGARKGLSARDGEVELVDCRLADQSEASLELFCRSRAERVTAASRGVALRLAGGELRADALELRGRDGAELGEKSRVWWKGGSCSAEACGLSADGAEVELSSVALKAGRISARLAGGARFSWDGGSCASEDSGLSVESADAGLRGVSFTGGRVGARLVEGVLELRQCSFDGQSEVGLESAAAARLDGVRARSVALGLKIIGGETSASELDIKGKDGAKVVGAGRLKWERGVCEAERVGLGVEGGEAELRAVRFSGGERGASVEAGALAARGAAFEGQSVAGATVGGAGRARFEDCSFSGAPTGASARGPVAMTDCRLRGHARQGVDLHGAGHELDGCELAECEVGAVLAGAARFSKVTASARRHAASLAAGSRLEWRGGAASAEGIGLAASDARAILEDLRCEGREGGALIEGGRLTAARCAFSGGGAALELRGGAHELSDVSAGGCDTGLVLADAECRAGGLELEGRTAGLLVRQGGILEWSRGRCAGPRALVVAGGRARLEDAVCAGDLEAVRLEGGSLSARGLSARGGTVCGVFVDGGAFCELSDSTIERAPIGVAARLGHVHLLQGVRFPGCAAAIAPEPAASLCLKRAWDGGPAAPRARPVLSFVLETKDRRLWRGLYWLVYAAGAAWLKLRLALGRGVEAARLHRGWITGDWQPGVSDLDALAVFKDLSGDGGARRLRALWSRYARWRRALPFLGEVLIAERSDFEAFVAAGGSRAATAARALRLPAPPAPARPGDLVECAHAYTRLLQCVFASREPWARNARHAEKAVLDVLRYGAFSEAGRPALSRSEAAEELRKKGSSSRVGAFEALSGPAPQDPTLTLARAAAEALYAFDGWLEARGTPEPSGRAVAEGGGRRSLAIDGLRSCFGPSMRGALVDDLYRSYVVLDARSTCAEDVAQSLAAAARRRPLLPGTLPVPVTRRLWSALARSSYMEDPTRGLGFDGSGAALAAGKLVPGVVQEAWGECAAAVAASPAEERAAARAAAANFALTWRWLGAAGPGADARGVYHYLLGRSLGLRLMLEKGIVIPFFELDALVSRAAREFPELSAPLSGLAPLRDDATIEDGFYAIYPLIDSQARRLVALLSERP